VVRFSVAAALAVLAVTSSAFADDTDAKNWNNPGVAELPATLKVPQRVLATVVAHDAVAPRGKKKKSSPSQCGPNGCGYKALLSDMPLGRDIQATPSVAVRVLPTDHALSGDDAAQPILVRPRVDGSGQYGVHLRAKF
jgi:hypothetical protein